MSARNHKFTQRESEFCFQMIIQKGNKTQAAIAAGYKERSAAQYAQKLLKKDYIRKRIEQLQSKELKKLEITAERILQELACIGFLDFGDLYDENGQMKDIHEMSEEVRRAIGGVTVTITRNKREDNEYETKTIKVIDKVKPLELLGKNEGLWAGEGETEINIITDADLVERLKAEKHRK